MALPPRYGLSLCAGGGGLDMGLGIAEPGFAASCYVEWEDYPRQTLIAAQRAGYLHPAPIWDNVRTFDARPWRGICDTLLAGYPCQPFSQAGQRKGADDPRHLWPDIARIIGELRPRWCFFENVSGHLSLGYDVVANELRGLGYAVAAGIFSAEETGAAHERQRLFIVAYCEGDDWGIHAGRRPERRGAPDIGGRGSELADTDGRNPCAKRQQRGGKQRFQPPGRGFGAGHVDDAECPERRADIETGDQPDRNDPGRGQAASRAGKPGCDVDHAPGPSDMDAWRAILDVAPDLAPSLSVGDVKRASDRAAQMVAQGCMAEGAAQSLVRGMAHGLASRPRALRLLGNGVHPLAAAYAWRSLSAAHGLGRVDLDAETGRSRDTADGDVLT